MRSIDAAKRVKDLTKRNSQLSAQLREHQADLQVSEGKRSRLEESLQTANRELKRLSLDKKNLTTQAKQLEVDLALATELLKQRDERLVNIREDLQSEMATRILELRQEKLQLHNDLTNLRRTPAPRSTAWTSAFKTSLQA